MARKAWDDLSPAYRHRLTAAGVTRSSHASGDLRFARGHKDEARQTYSADPVLTQLATQGKATEAQIRELGRSFTRPKWIPKDMRTEVAAALSFLPDPSKWKSVEFQAKPNGEPWTMIVTPKRGYVIVIEIPGGGYRGSGAVDVLDWMTEEKIWFDVEGTT